MATIIESSDDRNQLVNLDQVEKIKTDGYEIEFIFASGSFIEWRYQHQLDCKNDYEKIARCRLVNNR